MAAVLAAPPPPHSRGHPAPPAFTPLLDVVEPAISAAQLPVSAIEPSETYVTAHTPYGNNSHIQNMSIRR
jgi:hypothetical protein